MIVIARKGGKFPKVGAHVVKFLTAWMEAAVSIIGEGKYPAIVLPQNPRVRVQRASLLKFLLDRKGFYALPVIPSKVLNNPAAMVLDGPDGPMAPKGKRWIDSCWIVPADSLGKSGEADRSQCNSIRLWIEQNVPTVDSADVAVLFLPNAS